MLLKSLIVVAFRCDMFGRLSLPADFRGPSSWVAQRAGGNETLRIGLLAAVRLYETAKLVGLLPRSDKPGEVVGGE